MVNFIKRGALIFVGLFFCLINGFAQVDDQQIDISNPEFSEMDRNQDGLMSCTEMQTSQPGLFTNADFGEMDENNDGMVSGVEYTNYQNSFR